MSQSSLALRQEGLRNTERRRNAARKHQYARYSPLWENAGMTLFIALRTDWSRLVSNVSVERRYDPYDIASF